jgi:hypothetical protein
MSDGQPVERRGAVAAEASAANMDDIAELEKTEQPLAMKGKHDAA